MYVCILCVYVYIHVYMQVWVPVCVCVCACVCVCVHVSVCVVVVGYLAKNIIQVTCYSWLSYQEHNTTDLLCSHWSCSHT